MGNPVFGGCPYQVPDGFNDRNRFPPGHCYIGEIENGMRYPLGVYTKAESDAKYAPKSVETDVASLAESVQGKADQESLTNLSDTVDDTISEISDARVSEISGVTFTSLSERIDSAEYYVTPEMFGALGDGETNDTQAIQAALDTGKPVVLTKGKVYIASGIVMPNGSTLYGYHATIKAYDSGNDIVTMGYDCTLKDIYIRGISHTTLSACGLKFAKNCYRIEVDNIKIEFCDYAMKDTKGIWSAKFGKIHIKSCAHGMYINESASTSITIDNFLHENCGSPFYWKYVEYSSVSVLCGDYSNWGEESSTPYNYAFGTRDSYVYRFTGCKAINIGSMAGENNVGKAFCRIEYSIITVEGVYIVYHKSYDTSEGRALFSFDSNLSVSSIGPVQIYVDSQQPETLYDYFYDYPFNDPNFTGDYYILKIRNGRTTARTANTYIKYDSTKYIYNGSSKIIAKSLFVLDKDTIKFSYTHSGNYYIGICQRFDIVLTDMANEIAVLRGTISGRILNEGTIYAKCQGVLTPGYGDDTNVSFSVHNDYIEMTIPNAYRTAYVYLESVGDRLDFDLSAESSEPEES